MKHYTAVDLVKINESNFTDFIKRRMFDIAKKEAIYSILRTKYEDAESYIKPIKNMKAFYSEFNISQEININLKVMEENYKKVILG